MIEILNEFSKFRLQILKIIETISYSLSLSLSLSQSSDLFLKTYSKMSYKNVKKQITYDRITDGPKQIAMLRWEKHLGG